MSWAKYNESLDNEEKTCEKCEKSPCECEKGEDCEKDECVKPTNEKKKATLAKKEDKKEDKKTEKKEPKKGLSAKQSKLPEGLRKAIEAKKK